MTPTTSPELQAFVAAHYRNDLSKLAFRRELLPGYDRRFVMNQLYGKQKAATKLPTWFAEPAVLYPDKLAMEQCSSERTARFKADLIGGERLLDMTGGFGVDSFFFSKNFDRVDYVEQRVELTELAAANFSVLGATNITAHPTDALAFLKKIGPQYDWIFIDPARRDSRGGRVFRLADCIPNVLEIRDLLVEKSRGLLLKVSPMVDIRAALADLLRVSRVYVVAVANEVKELLLYADGNVTEPVQYYCVNLLPGGVDEVYQSVANRTVEVTYGPPESYLYEPNASILKAGLFNEIAADFGLKKLHPNSHLYTSADRCVDFPGRQFVLTGECAVQRKALRKLLPELKANLTVRNFPMSVAQLRKKLNLRDGGHHYLFATTLPDEQTRLLLTRKVESLD